MLPSAALMPPWGEGEGGRREGGRKERGRWEGRKEGGREGRERGGGRERNGEERGERMGKRTVRTTIQYIHVHAYMYIYMYMYVQEPIRIRACTCNCTGMVKAGKTSESVMLIVRYTCMALEVVGLDWSRPLEEVDSFWLVRKLRPHTHSL